MQILLWGSLGFLLFLFLVSAVLIVGHEMVNLAIFAYILIPIILLNTTFLYFSYEDRSPVVSPQESLILEQEPFLYKSGYDNTRAAELVANWHYSTKRECGMLPSSCFEIRKTHFFGERQEWLNQNSYVAAETACQLFRSDRYAVCLMGRWFDTYMAFQEINQKNQGFDVLSSNPRLRAIACEREPRSVYYCHK